MTLILVGLSSYLLAHIFSAWRAASLGSQVDLGTTRLAVATSDADAPDSSDGAQRYVETILASGLFQYDTGAMAHPEPTLLSGKPSLVKPLNVSTQVALIGLVLDRDGTHQAILETVSTRTQAMYRIHDQVPEVGELAIIEKDRILFRRGSHEEWLYHVLLQKSPRAEAPAEASPVRPTANRRVIDRRHLVQVSQSLESYLKEATFHPHFSRSSDIQGFRLEDIRQVGVVDLAGFQEDDILVGVNGQEMRDPVKLWNLFQQLPHEDVVHFNVMRQGEPMTLRVEIRG